MAARSSSSPAPARARRVCLTRRIARLVRHGGAALAASSPSPSPTRPPTRCAARVGGARRPGRREDVDLDLPLGLRADPAPQRRPDRLPPGFSIYDDGDSRRLVEHVLDDLGIDQQALPAPAVLGRHQPGQVGHARRRRLRGACRDDLRASGSPRPTPSTSARLVRGQRHGLRRPARPHRAPVPRARRGARAATRSASSTCSSTSTRTPTVAQNELVIATRRRRGATSAWSATPTRASTASGAPRCATCSTSSGPSLTPGSIVLDQNYRSTQTILDAANAVISNNLLRQEKELWSASATASRSAATGPVTTVTRHAFVDERDRHPRTREGVGYGDIAVFYRTNAQSRAHRDGAGRPWHRLHRHRRDPLLRPARDPRRARLPARRRQPRRRGVAPSHLNTPRRGIGDTTVGRLIAFARRPRDRRSPAALARADEAGASGKALAGRRVLLDLLDEVRAGDARLLPPGPADRGPPRTHRLQGQLEAEIAIGGAVGHRGRGPDRESCRAHEHRRRSRAAAPPPARRARSGSGSAGRSPPPSR